MMPFTSFSFIVLDEVGHDCEEEIGRQVVQNYTGMFALVFNLHDVDPMMPFTLAEISGLSSRKLHLIWPSPGQM